jgi:hypothetical protein
VQAETNNNQANAMSFWSTVDMYRGNASFVSTGGDVLIQANQGGISFNNQQPSAVGQLTDIKGRNITIDNTGAGMATGAYAVGAGVAGSGGTKGAAIGSGSIDTITGAITAGTGKATGTNGVLINDGRKLTADNNISITGVSSAGAGAGVYNNNGVITATTGKVAINGNAQGASGTAIYSTGAITGGSVYMNGSASGTGYGVITSSTGTVKSTVSDVWIEGLSQKGHGVYLQSTIDATATNIANGSSGITIKGSNNATGAYYGVYAGKAITAKSGAINITGTSYGTSDGVKLSSLAPITAEKDQVSIIGKALGTAASTASGVYSFAAIKGTSVSIEGESKATGTGAYYGVLGAGTIDATADYVNIKGTSATANSFAVYLQNTIKANGVNNQDGSAVNISGAGNSAGSAVYMEPTTAITNYSTGGTTNIKATQGNISFIGASSITNETNAGAINVIAGDGTAGSNSKIVADAGSIITQKSNAGINMTTDGTGNLTVAKIINNGSGDVVLAAGKQIAAGDGSGGQVQTISGNTVSSLGKLYVYTGSAAGTGLLQNLTGAFSTLSLSDYTADDSSTVKQNAAANVAYTTGSSRSVISPNTANAQVMFREKVAIDSSSLNGNSLNLTYGQLVGGVDVTHSGQANNLLSEMQAALRQANLGTATVATTTLTNLSTSGVNTFRISKAAVINDMTGSLSSPAYSTSQHLTAITHNYGALTGTNYTTSLAAGKAQVVVDKRTLDNVVIGAAGNTYGDTVGSGTVTFGNSVTADKVTLTADVVSGAGDLSTSGNLKANSYTQKTTAAKLAGDDSANYTVADTTTSTANYTVGKRTLDSVSIAAAGNTYGDTVGSGTVTFGNTKGTGATADKVTLTADVVSGAGDLSTSGNLKANSYTQKTTAAKLAGDDSANYTVADSTTSEANYTVGKKDVTISAAGKTVVFNNTEQSDTFNLDGIIRDDVIRVTGAGKGTAVGSYTSHLDANGDDIGNYNVQVFNKSFVIADAAKTNATSGTDPLLNPVPVNPNYKTPDNIGGASELVTTQHNNDQIQKQCSLEFSKECKAQPTLIQDYAPRYTTFY